MPVMYGWEFLDSFSTLNIAEFKILKLSVLSSTIDPEDLEKIK
jgi:hypothetical protein